MSDYIDREAAIRVLCDVCPAKEFCQDKSKCEDYDRFVSIPAADVRPVGRGRWIKKYADMPYECSICGEETRETVLAMPRFNYCPICGAKMEGTE